MANELISKQNEEIETAIFSSIPEWVLRYSWILASVIVGGIPSVYILVYRVVDYPYPIGPSLAGIIGSILVGFIPWLAQKRQISILAWRVSIFTSIALIIMALIITYSMLQQSFYSYILFPIVPSLLGSVLLAKITMGICKQWLKSKLVTWRLVFAGLLGLLIGFLMLAFVIVISFLMSSLFIVI